MSERSELISCYTIILHFVCLSVHDGRSPEVDLTLPVSLLPIAFLDIGKVGYDDDGIGLPLPISVMCGLENTWAMKIYTCAWRLV